MIRMRVIKNLLKMNVLSLEQISQSSELSIDEIVLIKEKLAI